MALGTSSKRYSKALISNSIDEGNLDVLFEEVCLLTNILEESDDLKDFIANPTISRENKTKLLNELTNQSLPNISKLIHLLSVNNRINILLDVCRAFVDQYNQYNNIIEVTVTTPVEISDDIKQTIEEYLSSIKQGKIKLTKKKDKSLIAGFTLDFDNTRLDASIKKRLEKMQKQLKTT